jgi:glutamate dehydrogenase (NAD(P)+)
VKTLRLKSVDAYVAFDFDCATSAGGTRLAPDVTEHETQLLARAMSYKFGILGVPIGGAKAAIRATGDQREEALRRYCAEIRPLVERRYFLTASDLGTIDADFRTLPAGPEDALMHSVHSGMALDAYITGLGVAVAAETALGGLEGRTIAIEGFGKIGGATAVEAVRRGARLVAFSTVHGAVERRDGFDVAQLLQARAAHQDRVVEHLGTTVRPASRLFEVEADVLVPGARIGAIDEGRAAVLGARLVAPAANVPYTRGALEVLGQRGVVALADFLCNSGATIGYVTPGLRTPEQALAAVEARVRELTRECLRDPEGAFPHACRIAEDYLRTWLPLDQLPNGPPLG